MMTVTEVTKYNYTEDVREYFREKEFEFVKYPSGKKGVYSSIERYTDFIEEEISFWINLKKEFKPTESYQVQIFDKIINNFKDTKDKLKRCENIKESDNYSYRTPIAELNNNLKQMQQKSYPNVYSQSEFAITIKQMIKGEYSGDFISGYFAGSFGGKAVTSITSRFSHNDFFAGYNIGMRMMYPQYFKEVDEGFIGRTEALIESLNDEYNEFSGHIEKRTRLLENRFESLEEENKTNVEDNQNVLNELRTTKETELDALIKEKKEKLEEQEHLYSQKLKLSEPADYWKNASDNYKRLGRIWSILSAVTGLVVMFILYRVLKNTTVKDVWNLESVKFTVILTVIISIGFLILNLTIKLALSNFHLATDAYERYKLTYLYLALLNEDKDSVSEKEKSIVFQSLFARSDSGLTKSDTGVQMPNTNQLLELHKK